MKSAPSYYKLKNEEQNEPQRETTKFSGIPSRIKKEINTASQGLEIANNIVKQDTEIKNKIKEMDAFTIVEEYTHFKKDGISPKQINNIIVQYSQLDELNP